MENDKLERTLEAEHVQVGELLLSNYHMDEALPAPEVNLYEAHAELEEMRQQLGLTSPALHFGSFCGPSPFQFFQTLRAAFSRAGCLPPMPARASS